MTRNDNAGTTYPQPRLTDDKKKQSAKVKANEVTPAITLDMGEASREEGFRLNGCR